MKKIIIASAIAVLTNQAYAQEVNQVKMPAGLVHGSNGMVFTKGKLATSLKTIFLTKDKLYDGSDEITNSSNKEMTMTKFNSIIRYGLGANFDLRMIIPFVNKSMSSNSFDFDNSGLGDIRVFTRYQITSPALGNSFFSTVGLGVELPTGSTDKQFYMNNGTAMSSYQPDGMQNGDGSIDPILEVGLTKPLPNSRIDFSAMYVFNQEGDNDFEQGDKFHYNLGYSYLLHPKFMPSLEFNGTFAEKNIKSGAEVDTSGGHELFITPGFSSSITKKLKVFAAIGIPIYRDLNTGALGSDTRITTKISYAW